MRSWGRLHAQGHNDESVSRALAQTWLEGTDYFELPQHDLMTRLDKPAVRVTVAVVGALVLTLAAILLMRHLYPNIAATFLAF